MKELIFSLSLALICILAHSQIIESDGFVIELTNFGISEHDVQLMGKQKLITGTFTVTKDNRKIATHDFLVPIMKEKISHITVLDSGGEKIFPRMHYLTEEQSYTYYEGTDKEGKEKITKTGNQQEIVLSGLIIWTRLTYK
jgi:hypothetical protein